MVRPHRNLIALLACLPPMLTAAHAANLSLSEEGVRIDAGAMGAFTLSYPALQSEDGQPVHELIEKTIVSPQEASVEYEGGATARLAVGPDRVTLTFENMSADAAKFRMDMLIDFGYSQGGTWQIGPAEAQPFPEVQPAAPHLSQGNARDFVLTSPTGGGLRFGLPQYAYQQLQDNREWNWKIFAWMFVAPYNRDWREYVVTIVDAGAPGAGPVVIVDRFGQAANKDFPGKVTSENELSADIARDEAYYAALNPPERDPYGGLLGSGTELGLEATGFFHVESVDDRWLLVDPAGNAFFHLGMCGFQPSDDYTYIKDRADVYEWLPDYDGEFHSAFHQDAYWSRDVLSFYVANLIRKYGKPYDRDEWMARIIPRVRRWGFTSVGAFSGGSPSQVALNFPRVAHLPLALPWQLDRPIPGLRGFFDPFDEVTAQRIDELIAESVAPSADDPLIIGYYLENEQACEDIPRVIPQLKSDAPSKLRLVAMLGEKYTTIDAFNAAWGMQAPSFEALEDEGLPVTTREASEDMADYTGLFLDSYYQLLTETFRRHDANHMLIGNRWMPSTANNEQLVSIAGRYMDVISVNYYSYGIDGDFLTRLYEWSGERPMILSEYHYCAPSDTGLPGGQPEVGSQRERGLAYRAYVEQSAALGFVVGCEWFTLLDQARTGRWFERYGGENANTGLFAVTDRPWYDFVEECAKTNYQIYDVWMGNSQPFVFDDPRFTGTRGGHKAVDVPRARGAMVIDGQRDDWPGAPGELISARDLVLGSEAAGVEASFRLCWDDENLYIMADVVDPTPMQNQHVGGEIWNGDGLEVFIGHESLDQPGALQFTDRQVLLSAGLVDGETHWSYANAPEQYPASLAVVERPDGSGYVIEAALPWSAFSFTPKPQAALLFDLGVGDGSDGQSRQRQLMWNGIARNSADRTYWGRAKLAE